MIDAGLLFEGMLLVYASLGKTGKPQRHEHTTLAGVAVSFGGQGGQGGQGGATDGRVIFIVLATGTKCLPAVARHPDGHSVHDSHAEVLARRTMVRWLMDEALVMYAGKPSAVFERGDGGRLNLRDGVAFHLVSSSPPCGDCAIAAPEGQRCLGTGDPADNAACVKRKRTGAKLVYNSSVLPRQEDVEKAAQKPGVVRRKPGRGSPTASTSCSDKILRWMHLGFQGCCFRSLLEQPLRFSSITAANASQEALQRGVWDRRPVADLKAPAICSLPVSRKLLDQYGLCSTFEARVVGAGDSVSWWSPNSHEWSLATNSSVQTLVTGAETVCSAIPKASKEFREVLTGKSGYCAGCSSKSGATPLPRFHSRLSRSSMRSHFLGLLAAANGTGLDDVKNTRSWAADDDEEFKRQVCPDYVAAWAELRGGIDGVFSKWIRK